MKYSNPRLEAHFENWPAGFKRVDCVFKVEGTTSGKGQRIFKHFIGRKPKRTIYAKCYVISTGEDGKVYLISKSRYMQGIIVQNHKFQIIENIMEDDERFQDLDNLFNEV